MARRASGSKRINGQGSIYKDDKRNRWRFQFYDLDGKRRTGYAKTRAEAEKGLRDALSARDAGTLTRPASQTPTVAGWLNEWVESHVVALAPSTASSYRLAVARITKHLGDKRIHKVTARDILWYQNQERARGLSEGSLLNDHRVLRRAFRDALQARLIAVDPVAGLKAPKPKRRPANPLTQGELTLVLEQARADGAMAYAMRRINLLYGPRQSEVLGLKWSDLNLETGDLRIQRALRRDAGVGRYEKAPKSSESIRSLHLDEETVAALKTWRVEQASQRLACSTWDDGEWIFTGRWGAPVEAARDYRLWRALLRRAGVRKVRLHDARHTAGTLMNATGTDPRTIQQILGHADVHTTLTYYVKPTDSLVAQAGERMAALVRDSA